jgi:hypothetical protein
MDDERIIALQDAIQRAFPAIPYTGKVTRCDGAWLPELTEENAIHDDDKVLFEALKNRKWTDVPKQFLYEMPGDFVLLTNEALTAFLAAWLMCSLDNIAGENVVREYVVYAFSPSGVTPTTDFITNQLRALNPEQGSVLRKLLAEFALREPSEFVKKRARDAVALIDSLTVSPQ